MTTNHAASDFRRTEIVDPRYALIDQMPVGAALQLQLQAQGEVIAAIGAAVPAIERAVVAAARVLKNHESGRLIYVGAGTSGRIGVQDGSELPPTFNWPSDRVAFVMAGGMKAITDAVEGAEDDAAQGAADIAALNIRPGDVVIGVTASGITPYTVAAVETARAAGAVTIGVANNADTPLLKVAEFPVFVDSGAEVVAGSTRLKAGTAQKIVLNMISTQIMIGLNHVYDGLMVDMRALNQKLVKRAVRMVQHVTGCDADSAWSALGVVDGRVKPAILVALGVAADDSLAALDAHEGNLRAAMTALNVAPPGL